jgi:hypothetical protein
MKKDKVDVISETYSKEKAQYLDILNLASSQPNLESFRFCTLTSYHTKNPNELDCSTPAPIKYDIRHLLKWCGSQINNKPAIPKEYIL